MNEILTPPTRPTIVVLDDDRDTVELMEMLLRRNAYAPLIFTDVEEALAAIAERSPAAVLCDACMPEMTGSEVLHRIRRLPGSANHTPVILVTGVRELDRIPDRASFAAHLLKPVRLPELLSTLAHVIAASQVAMRASLATIESLPVSTPAVDGAKDVLPA